MTRFPIGAPLMQRTSSSDDSAASESPAVLPAAEPAVSDSTAAVEAESPAASPRRWTVQAWGIRFGVYLGIAAVGATADLWTKAAMFRWRGLPGEQRPWWLVDNLLGVETAVNIGAVFGIGAGKGTMFAALSVLAGIGILVWLFWYGAARSWWLLVALAMVSGGIVGNLYDRLGLWWQPGMREEWRSGVRDWILMQAGDSYKWPNYNIADSLLVIGAFMLVWRSFFPPLDQQQTHEQAASR